MLGWEWLNDKFLDRGNIQRKRRWVDHWVERMKQEIAEARNKGASTEEIERIRRDWDADIQMASEEYEEVLTNKVVHEARKRLVEVPSRYGNTDCWYRTWEGGWYLPAIERRRLQRRIEAIRRSQCQLRLQAVSTIGSIAIGVVGAAAALVAVLLQFR